MADSDAQICRVTRSKAQAKAAYNGMGRWYDLVVGWGEKKARNTGLKKLAAAEGEQVLELGFGTGHCLVALAQSVGASGRVYGIDLAETMRDIAQRRVAKAGLSDRVELTCGDAARLPYGPAAFDAVFTSFALELFDTPEIPVVLQDCQRVLRGGGRIGVVASSKEGRNGVAIRTYEWLHKKLPNYVDCRPIYVRRAVEQAGFRDLDVTEMSWGGFLVEIVVARKA